MITTMKRQLVMVGAAVLLPMAAKAQPDAGSLSVQPMVGITYSTFSGLGYEQLNLGKEYADWAKYKWGLALGAECSYQLTKVFGLSLAVLYAQEGCWADGTYRIRTISSDDNKTNDFRVGLDYLNFPLLASLYALKGLSVKGGVQMGLLVRERLHTQSLDDWGADYDEFGCRRVVFGVPLGLSYESRNIVLDARYNIPLSTVKKESGNKRLPYGGTNAERNVMNPYFQLTLGYKIPLLRKQL